MTMTREAAIRRLQKHIEGLDALGQVPIATPHWSPADYEAVQVLFPIEPAIEDDLWAPESDVAGWLCPHVGHSTGDCGPTCECTARIAAGTYGPEPGR